MLATLCAALFALPQAASAHHLFRHLGSFGSATQPEGRFLDPVGIATDGAGRVYVVDRGAKRVEVYDSGEAGNGFLRSIGEGRLVDPVDIDIDERDRLYVSDSGADRIDVYDQFIRGGNLLQSIGSSGPDPGQLSRPQFVRADAGARAHAVELGNLRVSIFRSLVNGGGLAHSFRVGEPGRFDSPFGLALGPDGTMFVSNASPTEGRIRYWLRNGAYAGEIGAPGSGPGQLSSPAGIFFDGLGRLVVADAGNNRLQVWSQGFQPLDRYGVLGTGADEFAGPTDLDLAPGAMLYVTDRGNGRVVRLRYDDADRDGVTGARDNCRAISNPGQEDGDLDGRGDACDDDLDGDLVPSSSDLCPKSSPRVDRNGDGCGDPRSRISRPRAKRVYRPTAAALIRGKAAGDALGIAGVEVAVRRKPLAGAGQRKAGGSCGWYSKARRAFAPGACAQPRFFPARGRRSWYATLSAGALRPGQYTVMSRAVQKGGLEEKGRRARQNILHFRVR